MDSLVHRPLPHVLPLLLRARARVLLLDAGAARLEDGEAADGRLHGVLGDVDDVRDQLAEQVHRHALADYHAEDLDLLFVGWEGVVWLGDGVRHWIGEVGG